MTGRSCGCRFPQESGEHDCPFCFRVAGICVVRRSCSKQEGLVACCSTVPLFVWTVTCCVVELVIFLFCNASCCSIVTLLNLDCNMSCCSTVTLVCVALWRVTQRWLVIHGFWESGTSGSSPSGAVLQTRFWCDWKHDYSPLHSFPRTSPRCDQGMAVPSSSCERALLNKEKPVPVRLTSNIHRVNVRGATTPPQEKLKESTTDAESWKT